MNTKTRRPDTDGSMTRRTFLRLSGLLGAATATMGLMPVAAEAVKLGRDSHKISETTAGHGNLRFDDARELLPGSGPGGHGTGLRGNRSAHPFDEPVRRCHGRGAPQSTGNAHGGPLRGGGSGCRLPRLPRPNRRCLRHHREAGDRPVQGNRRRRRHRPHRCATEDGLLAGGRFTGRAQRPHPALHPPGHGHHPRRHRQGIHRGQGLERTRTPRCHRSPHQRRRRHQDHGLRLRPHAVDRGHSGPPEECPVPGCGAYEGRSPSPRRATTRSTSTGRRCSTTSSTPQPVAPLF